MHPLIYVVPVVGIAAVSVYIAYKVLQQEGEIPWEEELGGPVHQEHGDGYANTRYFNIDFSVNGKDSTAKGFAVCAWGCPQGLALSEVCRVYSYRLLSDLLGEVERKLRSIRTERPGAARR